VFRRVHSREDGNVDYLDVSKYMDQIKKAHKLMRKGTKSRYAENTGERLNYLHSCYPED